MEQRPTQSNDQPEDPGSRKPLVPKWDKYAGLDFRPEGFWSSLTYTLIHVFHHSRTAFVYAAMVMGFVGVGWHASRTQNLTGLHALTYVLIVLMLGVFGYAFARPWESGNAQNKDASTGASYDHGDESDGPPAA